MNKLKGKVSKHQMPQAARVSGSVAVAGKEAVAVLSVHPRWDSSAGHLAADILGFRVHQLYGAK